MWRFIAILLLVTSAKSADAQEIKPSFDCNAAHSSAEKLICSDQQLAATDNELAGVYREARRAGKVDVASQMDWLKRRDADCAGADMRRCLLRRMNLRIAVLHSAQGSGPSFDCDKAGSAQEYAICTDATLAQLDLVLAHAYRHALDAGKADKRSEVEWLRKRDIQCRATDQALSRPDPQRELQRCLENEMQRRLDDLQSAYGFSYGTASCGPNQTVSLTFDIPPVPETYLQAEYGNIFPDRLFTWQCEFNSHTSVTVKYGFNQNGPYAPCGTLSIWENGIKIARQLPLAQCDLAPTVQSVTLSASGLTSCFSPPEGESGARCKRTARTAFPIAKDPYFTPGRLPGGPEPQLVEMPMRTKEGKTDPRCKLFADRLAADWNDDFADLNAPIQWRSLEFPNDRYDLTKIAVADFDIDNDGKAESIVREEYHSHATEGERYAVLPANSPIRDLRFVNNDQEFYAALRDAVGADDLPGRAQGYRLPPPASMDDHYSLKPLTVDGRTVFFASPIIYWPPPNSWDTSDHTDLPARLFFEVQKRGAIRTICSFTSPYRLGAQL